MKDLVKFHSDNKYLLMAYDQNQLKHLGQIVGNHEKKEVSKIVKDYKENLGKALLNPPRKTNYINALTHIFGYFSDELSSKEKEFILDNFEKYRWDQIHLTVLITVLESYIIKYDIQYLIDQTIWITYPEDLLNISDTGKWKKNKT